MEPMSDAAVRTSLDKQLPDPTPADAVAGSPFNGPHAIDPALTGADPFGAYGPTAEPVVTAAPARGTGFRLHRSSTDKMLGGVCGGLAESLGVDPALLRVGLVALTLLGAGIGVVLYVAAWILAPVGDPAV